MTAYCLMKHNWILLRLDLWLMEYSIKKILYACMMQECPVHGGKLFNFLYKQLWTKPSRNSLDTKSPCVTASRRKRSTIDNRQLLCGAVACQDNRHNKHPLDRLSGVGRADWSGIVCACLIISYPPSPFRPCPIHTSFTLSPFPSLLPWPWAGWPGVVSQEAMHHSCAVVTAVQPTLTAQAFQMCDLGMISPCQTHTFYKWWCSSKLWNSVAHFSPARNGDTQNWMGQIEDDNCAVQSR